ncbi:unnamed protein product, partial [Rotaria sp. Silwood1]
MIRRPAEVHRSTARSAK